MNKPTEQVAREPGVLAPETYARKLASLSDTDFLSEEDIREIRRELLEHDHRLRSPQDAPQKADIEIRADIHAWSGGVRAWVPARVLEDDDSRYVVECFGEEFLMDKDSRYLRDHPAPEQESGEGG